MMEIERIHEEIWRMKLDTFESYRLETYSIIAKKMLEAVRSGISVEGKFMDLSGTKERYLEALWWYKFWGLTADELCEKRMIWLWRPGERGSGVSRVKTVSMFLQRLKRAGLASRVREGHSWRYFITKDGTNRLEYYRKRREASEKKARLLGLLW